MAYRFLSKSDDKRKQTKNNHHRLSEFKQAFDFYCITSTILNS